MINSFVEAVFTKDLKKYIQQCIKQVSNKNDINKEVFQNVLELNIAQVFSELKQQSINEIIVSKLIDDIFTQQNILFNSQLIPNPPELPNQYTFNQHQIFQHFRNKLQSTQANNQDIQNIMNSHNPEAILVLLIKSFADQDLQININKMNTPKQLYDKMIQQPVLSIKTDENQVYNIIHNNSLYLNNINNIQIQNVMGDEIFKIQPSEQLIKILTNINLNYSCSHSCLNLIPSNTISQQFCQQLENQTQNQTIDCNLSKYLTSQTPKLIINQIYYICNQLCQPQVLQDTSEAIQKLGKVLPNINIQYQQNDESKNNNIQLDYIILLYSIITTKQQFIFKSRSFVPNINITDNFQQDLAQIEKQLYLKLTNSQYNIAYALAYLPVSQLLKILAQNYPLFNISSVLLNRTLNEGPIFVCYTLQHLIEQASNFPLEFHYFCFELFQKTPWLYIQEPNMQLITSETILTQLTSYHLKIQQSFNVDLNVLKQNFGDNSITKKQCESIYSLLLQPVVDTERIADLVFTNSYYGQFYFQKSEASANSNQDTEANSDSLENKIQNNVQCQNKQLIQQQNPRYTPNSVNEATQMVKQSFNQNQDQIQMQFIKKLLFEVMQKIQDQTQNHNFRVRLLQFLIISIKKYKILLSNTPNVFGCLFQNEASLSFQFVCCIIKSINIYKTIDLVSRNAYQEQINLIVQQKNILEKEIKNVVSKEVSINPNQQLIQIMEQYDQLIKKNLSQQQQNILVIYLSESDQLSQKIDKIKNDTQQIIIQQKQLCIPPNGQLTPQKQQELNQNLQLLTMKLEQSKQQNSELIQQIQQKQQQLEKHLGQQISKLVFLKQGQTKQYNELGLQFQQYNKALMLSKNLCSAYEKLIQDELLTFDDFRSKIFIFNQISQIYNEKEQIVIKQDIHDIFVREFSLSVRSIPMETCHLNELTRSLNSIIAGNARKNGTTFGQIVGEKKFSVCYHVLSERMTSEQENYFQFLCGMMNMDEQKCANYLLNNIAFPLFDLVFPRFAMFRQQLGYKGLHFEDVFKSVIRYGELIEEYRRIQNQARTGQYNISQEQLKQFENVLKQHQPQEIKLQEARLPASNKSLSLLPIESVANIISYLLIKRGAPPSSSEFHLEGYLTHAFCSFGGLYYNDFCVFIRQMIVQLEEKNYIFLKSGIFDQLIAQMYYVLQILKFYVIRNTDCPYYMLLVQQQRIDLIEQDFNIIIKSYNTDLQQLLKQTRLSSWFIGTMYQFICNYDIGQTLRIYTTSCSKYLLKILEQQRASFNNHKNSTYILGQIMSQNQDQINESYIYFDRITLAKLLFEQLNKVITALCSSCPDLQNSINYKQFYDNLTEIYFEEICQWINTLLVLAVAEQIK